MSGDRLMARALEEWIGKDDNTAIPDRVRLRVFTAADGRCTICRRKIRPGETWTLEHVIALINWRATDDQPHGNRESNLGVTCCNCLPVKNAADVGEKKIINRTRAKHLGIDRPKGFWRPPGMKFDWRAGRYGKERG